MEADIPTPDQYPPRTHRLPARLLGDERLAQEVSVGSEPAFTTLFRRYHQQLYRYCRGLTGNEQDAQDALQTTFTKALIALREGRRNAPVRPWLYRIAHNESISVIRARNATLVDLPQELEATHTVVDSVEERERLATLVADLRELPEQQRGALVMRELSGLSHEEIAAVLQVSVGAAKQSILEARRSLMEFAEGRAMTCDEVQRIVSDDDRRSLRSRRVRAHLRDCASCAAFAQAIPRRRADMLALWPALPVAGSAGLLAKLTGAGSGHGGGGAGLVAGTAAKGVGATISIKAAAAAGAAVVATATVGAVAVLHQPAPAKHSSVSSRTAASHRTSGSGHGSAAGRSGSGSGPSSNSSAGARTPTHSGANHHAAAGNKGQGAGAGKRAQGNHGRTHTPAGHGHGLATAPGQSGSHGNSVAKSVNAAHHGPVHTAHGKPVKVNPSVVHKSTNPKMGHGKLKPKSHEPPRLKVKSNEKDKPKPVTHSSTSTAGTTKTAARGGSATTSTLLPSTTSTVLSTTVQATTTSPSSVDNGHGNGNGGTPANQSAGSSTNKSAK